MRRLLAQPARDLHAVFALQPHVEHDQVDDLARHHRGELRAGRDGGDAQLVVAQVVGDQLRGSPGRRRSAARGAGRAGRHSAG